MMYRYYCPVCRQKLQPLGHTVPHHSDTARYECPASGQPLRIAIQRALPEVEADERVLAAAMRKPWRD